MAENQVNIVYTKSVIVVLGMHRSGTSAITRGLQVLGADLGPELMPAIAGDNDKGFWEDLGCYRINERILKKLDMSWDAAAEIPEASLTGDILVQEHHDAIALLRSRLAGVKVFAFKDPRTVNLLPFWQKVFYELGLDDRYLLILRNPRSVADSLAKRNKFDREKSFCLWMKHTCNALRYAAKKPLVLADYDRFMEAPANELERMAEPLGLAPLDKEAPAFHEYLDLFLSKDLRHSKYDQVNALGDVVPPFVAELYKELLSEVESESRADCAECYFDRYKLLCEGFYQYSGVMAYVDRLEQKWAELEIANKELEVSNKELEATNKQLETADKELETTNKELEPAYKELDSILRSQTQLAEELEEHLKGLYAKVLMFERSMLGRIFTFIETIYLALRLRLRPKTFYGQLVKESKCYLEDKGISPESYASPGRIYVVGTILRHIARHPSESLRLVSISRIKKLLKVMFSSDSSMAASWINARFPINHKVARPPVIFSAENLEEDIELIFPVFDHPLVSIVIPVYNQYQTTLSCLKAVIEHTDDVSYEVVVADDCSTDITNSIESRIHNIKVVRGEKNLGFLGNCNHAVASARGKYVVLLNNDTNVLKGWLSALVNTIESDPKIGMVGPKLLFEDGVLQEAGGIVWKDGSGWNYGRGQSPDLPEFNYVREVDYISGACILLEKRVWDELGGFDERFFPAYYEDTDLAFQLRARGLKVLYQPEAEVVHFEGVSNGTDAGGGVKKHQAINQRVFRDKWRKTLDEQHFENAQNVFQARERSEGKRTVVFIDHYVPFYDQDAGSRSTFFYIKSMVDAGLNVKFVPANFFPHQPYTRTLQQLGVEVLFGPRCMANWKAWFTENSQYIDVIYLHRPHVTEVFIDHLVGLKPRPKLIYSGLDLHYLRTQREYELLGHEHISADAEKWKRRELAIFGKVDKAYYPSYVEVEEINRVSPATDVAVIPLYVLNKPDVASYKHDHRDGLLFVGGFSHPPNMDAVLWFVQEVFPSLRERIPDICFHVVGSSVPEKIEKLADEHVKIHGFLSDDELSRLYQQIKICVVPLRYGAGVKGKILEALQSGVPIVTTPIGAEGLPGADRVMAIAENSDEILSNILTLYNNPAICKKYLECYVEYIEQNFSEKQVQNIIEHDFLN